MIDILKELLDQKVTVVVAILGAVLIFFALFNVDISRGVVQPQSLHATTPLVAGVAALLLALVGSVVSAYAGRRDSEAPASKKPVHAGITTTWYSEWRLGARGRLYKETLRLQEQPDGVVGGLRWLETADGATEYAVIGFARGGFYWLEYHDQEDRGGGTLLLHEFTSGRLRGLITAANCDTGRICCVANQWVPKSSEHSYDRSWQEPIGEI